MKKIFRFTLAVLLILALVLPAAAVVFSDNDAIRNAEAVSVLRDLGVVCGYPDGRFLPMNNLKRSEAAKLIALMSGPLPEYLPSVHFSDLPDELWAYPYAVLCTVNGLMDVTDGCFRPNGYLTAREFARVLLICLGYDPLYYSGTDWEQAVDVDAARTGIYSGLMADKGLYISRDDACMLMYNAMQGYAVSGRDAAGNPVYVLDELMNPVTYMENRFGMVKFSSVLMANQYADLTADGAHLADGRSKLAGHTEFEIATPYEFLGHTVEFYTIRFTVGGNTYYTAVGSPNLAIGETSFVATSMETYTLAQLYSDYRTAENTQYFLNGDRTGSYFAQQLGSDYTITCVDNNNDRIFDYVLATDYSQGVLSDAEKLTVTVEGETFFAAWLGQPRAVQNGQAVRCVRLGGRWFLA